MPAHRTAELRSGQLVESGSQCVPAGNAATAAVALQHSAMTVIYPRL
ncbi:hypothetical protein [Mycobacterium sp. SMC-11]